MVVVVDVVDDAVVVVAVSFGNVGSPMFSSEAKRCKVRYTLRKLVGVDLYVVVGKDLSS